MMNKAKSKMEYRELTFKDLKYLCLTEYTYAKTYYSFMRYGRTISGEQWSNILLAYPQFIGECDLRLLTEGHWRKILREQPQLADACPHTEWTNGIVSWREDYTSPKELAKDDRLGSFIFHNNLVDDLIFHPVHAEYCDWSKLSLLDWLRLLLFHPEFVVRCNMSTLSAPQKRFPVDALLYLQPQWEKYFDIARLFNPGAFLKRNPEYEKNCNWDSLSFDTWETTIRTNPKLLKYCDLGKYPLVSVKRKACAMDLLNRAWCFTSPVHGFPGRKEVHKIICEIVRKHPVFLQKRNLYAASLHQDAVPKRHELGYFLAEYPELYPLCKKAWLTSQDWGHFIMWHPEMIHEADFDILTADAWYNILMLHPELAEHCNAWGDFSAKQWHGLLCGVSHELVNPCSGKRVKITPHPELFAKCPIKQALQ